MKILLFLLLSVTTALCQFQAAFGTGKSQPSPQRMPTYHYHPDTPLLSEDFEKPIGYDLGGWGEVLAGSGPVIDEDYTSTILRGTQSLFVDMPGDDQCYTTNAFPATAHVWLFFMLRPTTFETGVDSSIVSLFDSSGNCLCKITLNNDGGTFKVFPDCSTGLAVGTGLTVNTTYNVWVEFNSNNGSGNSYASLAYSVGQKRPTSGGTFVEGTGATTASPSRIRIGNTDNAQLVNFVIDHVIVDDAQIGDYP